MEPRRLTRPSVAFVSQPWATALPPSESVAIWIAEVARRLATSMDVVVYARGGRRGISTVVEDGVEYRHVPAEADWRVLKAAAPFWRRRPATRPFFASYAYHAAYLAHVVRDIRRMRPDVVHVHNFSQFVRPLRLAAPRSALVLHMHCEWLNELDPVLVRRRIERADAVIGCSEHVTAAARRRFADLADRFAVVWNGVDVDRFQANGGAEPARLLFVGRVAPDKGLHVLAEAFDRLAERHGDVELELVGPEAPVPLDMQVAISGDARVRGLAAFYGKGYVDALRSRLSTDAAARLRVLGKLPYADVPGRYRQATVLVNPSFEEAFGMAVVEAMASRLPVVATTVGGMPELVLDGETGFLVEPGDATALAERIGRLLDDPALARRFGAEGRRRAVRLFSWDRIADTVARLYDGLLAAQRG